MGVVTRFCGRGMKLPGLQQKDSCPNLIILTQITAFYFFCSGSHNLYYPYYFHTP